MRTKDTLSRKRTKWLTLAIAFVMTATAVISVIPNDVASDDADGGTYALGAVPGYTGIPDTSWYNSGTTNFNISNADQLAGLARLVNDGEDFSGRSVHIDNDIDLSCYGAENTAFNNGKGWIPIGQNTSVFRGIFNGGDHEITGLYMNDMSAGYGGLFGSVNASDGGYIQNLGVLGTVIIGNGIAGGIAGRYTTLGGMMEMSGCHFEGTVSGTFCVGGIVGRVDDTQTMYGSITGCYSAGEIIVRSTSSLIYVGGIAGQLVGAASIQGCYSTSMIAVSSAATGADVNVGGIAGNMSSSLSFVDHCAALNPSVTVACDVTAVVSIGRVAGYLYPFSSHLDNNVAFNGMKVSVNGVGTPIDDGSGSTVDGSSATVSAINSTNYFYNLFNGSYYYYWVYVALEEGGVLPSNHCGIAHTPLWLRTG
ncbi:MAG: hypothetical protein FWH44_04500, partial [Methanomassiliicoccaceae archaeon]|nr:hypothetical protein [Methanomassiliicoccaceae archaeon]